MTPTSEHNDHTSHTAISINLHLFPQLSKTTDRFICLETLQDLPLHHLAMGSNTILDPATYTAVFAHLPQRLNPLSIFTGCAAIYLLGLAIYRLYLAPQSKFPGPRLAALCYWYEFYYDVWPHEGQYTWKIRDLHEKYGMEAVFCHHVQLDIVLSKICLQPSF